MNTVHVNGLDLAYERRGRGEVLVLLHGFPLEHGIWDPLVPLLEADFDLLLPDLRGFGASQGSQPGFGIPGYVADLAGLLDQQGIERAFIAGHSMGGFVAAAFSAAHPDRVGGLALVAAQVGLDSPEKLASRQAVVARVRAEGVTPVVESMPPLLSSDPAVQNQLSEIIQRQSARAVLGGLEAMIARGDYTPALPGFDFPLVLICGLADPIIAPERFREMRALARRAWLVELEGVGHMPMMEAPPETAGALKRFLDG
ncbi:MAG: alpha/beta hydrolase [Anaerolineales bacterium]|nr:alpha/beta hydrolase [Anaerolineales bacterium]